MNDTNSGLKESSEDVELTPWEPNGLLRRVDRREVELSRGFLRSKPERWVPNLMLHWTPLIHSVGADIRIIEVRPILNPPQMAEQGVMLALGKHFIVVGADSSFQSSILDAIVPDSTPKARSVVLEYLGRRLLGSLAISWGGQETGRVRVFGGIQVDSHEYGGAVKIVAMINGRPATLFLFLSGTLVDELDRLWRLELLSLNRAAPSAQKAFFEIAQLAVPPAALSEYLRSGQAVDLDVAMSDNFVLRIGDSTSISARMCEVESNLGCEVVLIKSPPPAFPEGFDRFSVVFGTIDCDSTMIAEWCQPGVVIDTGLPLGDRIELWVNGVKSGKGVLRSYKGRFAVEVD